MPAGDRNDPIELSPSPPPTPATRTAVTRPAPTLPLRSLSANIARPYPPHVPSSKPAPLPPQQKASASTSQSPLSSHPPSSSLGVPPAAVSSMSDTCIDGNKGAQNHGGLPTDDQYLLDQVQKLLAAFEDYRDSHVNGEKSVMSARQAELQKTFGNKAIAAAVLFGMRSRDVITELRWSGTVRKDTLLQCKDRILPTEEFCVAGIYTDFGKETMPMSREHEVYCGSGCGLKAEYLGSEPLVGVAKRVFIQHEKRSFRESRQSSAHYRLGYREDHLGQDEPHIYTLCWSLDENDLATLLGHEEVPSKAIVGEEAYNVYLQTRHALIGLVESVIIRLIGAHRLPELDSAAARNGFDLLTIAHQGLNRASGLERAGDWWNAESGRLAGKIGGNRAKLAYAKKMELPEGTSVTLGRYMRFLLGDEEMNRRYAARAQKTNLKVMMRKSSAYYSNGVCQAYREREGFMVTKSPEILTEIKKRGVDGVPDTKIHLSHLKIRVPLLEDVPQSTVLSWTIHRPEGSWKPSEVRLEARREGRLVSIMSLETLKDLQAAKKKVKKGDATYGEKFLTALVAFQIMEERNML